MNYLMSLAATAVAFAAATPALAQQKLVPAHSEIAFVSKQMGVPVEGRFKKFDARVAFDPRKPEAASIAFTVDLGSASLGAPESEAELVKPLWFNLPKFPQASFQSSSVKALGGGKYEVAGKLNIKGNARDLVVPVALAQSGANTTASGAFTIKRLDFKIGEGEWADTSMVANEVQVRFKLALTGVGPL
ncbi:YceI family protein [Aquabacterium sp. A7-Y]|uniref:YceI family protein n=1 Tax=Aquabacterium sp. A7-Y TaxID=1349605 RepID=UPI00223CC51C|nr:YceI family protein [Aquabacterium sp. A7-Y]MCW7539525.1 YceI family protein [Aquabacterium sp. A7-Y]